jgi:hypothetical protein
MHCHLLRPHWCLKTGCLKTVAAALAAGCDAMLGALAFSLDPAADLCMLLLRDRVYMCVAAEAAHGHDMLIQYLRSHPHAFDAKSVSQRLVLPRTFL